MQLNVVSPCEYILYAKNKPKLFFLYHICFLFFFFYYYFLVAPHGLQDLSSLTRG